MDPNLFPTAIASVDDMIAVRRESMRSTLAIIVITLLTVLTLWLLWFVGHYGGGDASQLAITGLFTPIIGIAGTVLGFYFGSQESK